METWEQDLADVIDDYLKNYAGMTGTGSPLYDGLSPTAGPFMITQAQQTTVDPSFIIGIARSESSLATNPHINGGKFNVFGNSYHFTYFAGTNKKTGYPPYTNYEDPTKDAFALLQTYAAASLVTIEGIYKRYEGEASWNQNVPMIKAAIERVFGDVNNVKYIFSDARKKKLADKAAKIRGAATK
jgi:hypothetical protein